MEFEIKVTELIQDNSLRLGDVIALNPWAPPNAEVIEIERCSKSSFLRLRFPDDEHGMYSGFMIHADTDILVFFPRPEKW